jgi:NADP-dependent aldehyde dehydrogenase
VLRAAAPEQLAAFLDTYAAAIAASSRVLVAAAHAETALAVSPRLVDVELPRTIDQLRQAASMARDGTWAMPTIDTRANIRSILAGIGPVAVFGPNNFPFAYGCVSGGDFASAIATGNPVIGKAHPAHPHTTRLLAELAYHAVMSVGLPPATVQLIYHMSPEDGLRLVADRRIGATGFTGSRAAGLKLKAAADHAGRPIYLEMSSLNPVVILPGSLMASQAKIVDELAGSCLGGGGQFCTKPGLVFLLAGDTTERFIAHLVDRFASTTPATLLTGGVASSLASNVTRLEAAGAQLVVGGHAIDAERYAFANTLLRTSASHFLSDPDGLQIECFGNASLLVIAESSEQLLACIASLDGNLTGSIYSDPDGSDDKLADAIASLLRPRVGRLLNDKMPTGVTVSPAMNHGGPFPATGHPGFTAVGFPACARRFTQLQCFDHVRAHRLPRLLMPHNPDNRVRLLDGQWTTAPG